MSQVTKVERTQCADDFVTASDVVAAVSPESPVQASVGADNKVIFTPPDSGQNQGLFQLGGLKANCLAYTPLPTGERVALATDTSERGDYDGTTWTWSALAPTPVDGAFAEIEHLVDDGSMAAGRLTYIDDGVHPAYWLARSYAEFIVKLTGQEYAQLKSANKLVVGNQYFITVAGGAGVNAGDLFYCKAAGTGGVGSQVEQIGANTTQGTATIRTSILLGQESQGTQLQMSRAVAADSGVSLRVGSSSTAAGNNSSVIVKNNGADLDLKTELLDNVLQITEVDTYSIASIAYLYANNATLTKSAKGNTGLFVFTGSFVFNNDIPQNTILLRFTKPEGLIYFYTDSCYINGSSELNNNQGLILWLTTGDVNGAESDYINLILKSNFSIGTANVPFRFSYSLSCRGDFA